jgi:hypothetical protein
MYALFCTVLSFVGRGLGRSSVKGVLRKCLQGFIVYMVILNRNRPNNIKIRGLFIGTKAV